MPAVTRHRLPNAGKPCTTHLPAETCFAKIGGATRPLLAGLAYWARMGGNTFGVPASTYWRRRFLMLVAGLTVFGLAAWGLSSALAVGQRQAGQSRQNRSPATHKHGSARAGTSASSRSDRAGRSQPRSTPTRPASTRRSHRPRASRAHVSGRRQSSRAGKAAGAGAGQANGHGSIFPAFCARRDIVLSLFTSQTQYSHRQQPVFDVNVVSTQQAECSFNVGSQHLTLVIREGPARIWSSADCAAGTGGLIAALKRGVPTVLTFTWQRQTSAPGCSVRTRNVPPGTYTAYAVDGPVASAPVTIRLA